MAEIMSLPKLQSEAADALRRYTRGSEQEHSTRRLREIATLFVAGREHFTTKEGDVDWLGKSHAYRRWIQETYSLAEVPKEDLSTLQAAIRYHYGNVLRDRLDSDTLADLGLLESGPRARKAEEHRRSSETLTLFSGGEKLYDAEEILSLARMTANAFGRIDLRGVAKAPDELLPQIREAMESVYTVAAAAAGVAAGRAKVTE